MSSDEAIDIAAATARGTSDACTSPTIRAWHLRTLLIESASACAACRRYSGVAQLR